MDRYAPSWQVCGANIGADSWPSRNLQKTSYTIASLIRQGLPVAILMEAEPFPFTTIFKRAIDLVIDYNNYALVDALLSRDDIQDVVMRGLFNKGMISLKLLQYLENHGADIGKICFNSESDVMCELLSDYERIIHVYGDERCKELCEIIDFLKIRGVDTTRAYMALASAEDDDPWKKGECFNEVAKRLKIKGGKQWKLRG